jgi:hypothetical protein
MGVPLSIRRPEASVLAMLLQMVFEKLGKAALLRSGMLTVEKAQTTNQAAKRMLQGLSRPRQCEILRFNPLLFETSLRRW